MPPKSSTKKDHPPPLWLVCDKCRVHITSKEREQHESHCPVDYWESPAGAKLLPCSFVHDRHLYTTSVTAKFPADSRITDLAESQLNGIVCVSESTMSLCGWMLADLVVCSSPQLPDDVPVVRTVWPVPDRVGTTVFVSESGKEKNGNYILEFSYLGFIF